MLEPDLDRTQPVRAYIHHLYADADDDTCRSRYLLLVIHPNVEQLRAAQAAYEQQRDRKAGLKPAAQADDSEACGLWQPLTTQSRYDRRRKVWLDTTPPFLGVIRLAQGYLTPEIVALDTAAAIEAANSTSIVRCTFSGLHQIWPAQYSASVGVSSSGRMQSGQSPRSMH